MIDAIQPALSALSAFRKKMGVTSNNIANVNTDEFKKSRAAMTENADGGVDVQIQKVDTPGIPKVAIRGDKPVEVESSNVDLIEELTDMIPTQTAFNANLKTLQTSNEMMGSLLDILG